jgi:energy-coupling factor transporter ATP-binding protein EcfA2
MTSLNEILKGAEIIGYIGSPSTSAEIKLDLLETAYTKAIVGNFCLIAFKQDGKDSLCIGQLTETTLRNPYIERHSVEKIIAVRGQAKPLSGEHDVLTVILVPGTTYTLEEGRIIPSSLATVPSTGTPAYILNQNMVENLIPKSKEIAFVGKMYGTDILLPMLFKHFGKVEEGGLGEAYHLGVFGKTGSGKSYLARMLCSIYGRYSEMSILGIDPTGEYAREITKNGPLGNYLKSIGRQVSVYDISQISLTRPEALKRILLTSDFLDRMGVRARENQEYAANLISEFFERTRSITTLTNGEIDFLPNAYKREVFNQLLNYIKGNIRRIYVSTSEQTRVQDILNYEQDRLFPIWRSIAVLFDGRRKSVDDIIREVCVGRKIIFINLSQASSPGIYWNDRVMAIVMDEILKSLVAIAGELWREKEELLNLLVMIDEAHRFVPRETPSIDEFKSLKKTLVDAVLETRKYGLGWLFISQSLATVDMEILRQLRIYFIGYGLSWGSEYYTLEQLVGRGSYLELYASFKDPQTAAALGRKEYPFMVYGPISPLSISGKPIFFVALDYFTEFPNANNFKLEKKT